MTDKLLRADEVVRVMYEAHLPGLRLEDFNLLVEAVLSLPPANPDGEVERLRAALESIASFATGWGAHGETIRQAALAALEGKSDE